MGGSGWKPAIATGDKERRCPASQWRITARDRWPDRQVGSVCPQTARGCQPRSAKVCMAEADQRSAHPKASEVSGHPHRRAIAPLLGYFNQSVLWPFSAGRLSWGAAVLILSPNPESDLPLAVSR